MPPEKIATPDPGQAEAPDVGQVAVSEGQGTGQPELEAPFHQYHFPGEKEPTTFKSKEDLDKFLRDSSMRHSDYTRKTQELSRQRKEFEEKSVGLDKTLGSYARYNEIDAWLKTEKGQKAMQMIEKEMTQPSNQAQVEEFRSYADQRYSELEERLKSYEQAQAQREQEAMRDSILEKMGSKYDDLDKSVILDRIKSLSESPDDASMEDFMDLVYWAEKGRASTAQLEQRMTENQKKKQSIKPPMTTAGVKGGPPQFKTIEEAAEYARQMEGET